MDSVNRKIIGYDGWTSVVSFTTSTAGTCAEVGSITLPYSAVIYAASIAINSADTAAVGGAGILMLRVELPGGPIAPATVAMPLSDTFLVCSMIPTAKGIFGESRIIFGKDGEAVNIPDTQQVGIYCYYIETGRTITGLVNLVTRPTQNQTCS